MTDHDQLSNQLDDLGRKVRPAEAFTDEVLRRLSRIEDAQRESEPEDAVAMPARTDVGGRPGGAQRVRRLWRALVPAAAAVATLVAVAWLLLPNGTAFAWDDVVKAMGRVQGFRVTLFNEDPNRTDESRRLYKIEFHYRAPDQWRAEGVGHVQFIRGDEVRLYSAEKRDFVDPAKARLRLIPPDFVARLGQGDLLQEILTLLFEGDPPEGKPVRSDGAAEAGGVEVFDYARDATKRWARIWVLRESRLPLRIKVFEPRQEDFMLLTFDYSDPQPESYFDPEHFRRVVIENGLRREYQILRAGAEPLSGNPTEPGHVHEMLGDYKAAELVLAAGRDDGIIAIEHTDPDNVAPRGGCILHEGYEAPTDNWGNVYYMTGGFKPVSGNWRYCYVPLPEFKRGEGERIVTLRYAIEAQVPAKSKMYSHELIYRVLKEERVPVGLDSADKVAEESWAKSASPEKVETARIQYLRQSAPALTQWRHIEEQLTKRPRDLQLLCWEYDLLREHGRQEKAQAVAAEEILPAFLEDPVKHYAAGWTVGLYLREVADRDGLESLLPLTRRLGDVWQRAQKELRRGELQNAEYLFKETHSALGWLVQVPQALASFEAGPKPQATDIVRGRDGRVAVRVVLPDAPPREAGAHPSGIWELTRVPPGTLWRTLARHNDMDGRRYAWLLEPSADAVPEVFTLGFKPYVIGRSGRGLDSIQTRWDLTIPVPTEPTVDSVADWWAANVSDKDWHAKTEEQSPYYQLSRAAATAFEDRQYEDAIRLYEQLIELPKDQWPEYMLNPANGDMYEVSRQNCRHCVLEARIGLGKIDDTLAVVAAEEAKLPPLDPKTEDYAALREGLGRRNGWRRIRLAAVRYLIERGRLDEASAMMNEIARSRPDPMRFTDSHIALQLNGGYTSFVPRHEVRRLWREFDTVAWDLSDKIEQQARQQGHMD
ncbi:MAG: hypothetical protein JXL80_10495 [Planctomycetes bacterium]|nr:hypothetical protein [Planctomycetota bacterium]